MVSGVIKSKVRPFSALGMAGCEELESGRQESAHKALKSRMPAGVMLKHLKEREKRGVVQLIALCFGPRFSPGEEQFGNMCKITEREKEREKVSE